MNINRARRIVDRRGPLTGSAVLSVSLAIGGCAYVPPPIVADPEFTGYTLYMPNLTVDTVRVKPIVDSVRVRAEFENNGTRDAGAFNVRATVSVLGQGQCGTENARTGPLPAGSTASVAFPDIVCQGLAGQFVEAVLVVDTPTQSRPNGEIGELLEGDNIRTARLFVPAPDDTVPRPGDGG